MGSQTRMVLSLPVEAIRLPSGDQAIPVTLRVWPRYMLTRRCEKRSEERKLRLVSFVHSQTCTLRSLLAEAICLPSGDHERAVTLSVCPLKMKRTRRVATSQT